MYQKRSLIALILVLGILAVGVTGWTLDNETLQLAFFAGAIALIALLATAGKVQTHTQLYRLMYDKKEFERTLEKGRTWSYRKYLAHILAYGVIALIGGIGLLYYYYTINPVITALLWGITGTSSGVSALLLASIFRESDITQDREQKENRARFLWKLLGYMPVLVIIAYFFVPSSSALSGDLLIINVFGLLCAPIGVLGLLMNLWNLVKKVAKR